MPVCYLVAYLPDYTILGELTTLIAVDAVATLYHLRKRRLKSQASYANDKISLLPSLMGPMSHSASP